MLITPHQIAIACQQLDVTPAEQRSSRPRWTWIAGRRYRSVGRL